jgi:hypothetical protein
LISMGVKVEEALAWVYDFLGWGEPKLSKSGRTLADDLQEFIDLLPLDDIQAIADDHLATDGAFAAVVLFYILSLYYEGNKCGIICSFFVGIGLCNP